MKKLVVMMGTLCLAVGAQDHAAGKKVTRLGVATVTASDEIRAQLDLQVGVGLTVKGVTAGSPAAKAGIEINDILTKLDSQILMDTRQLRNLIVARKAGDEVKLTYLRKGNPITVLMALDEQEQEATTGGVIDLGVFNIGPNEMTGKMPGASRGEAVKVITFGPNGMSNMKDSEVGAKLMEVLNQVLGGAGSNVSVTVQSLTAGGTNMTDTKAANQITAEISKALKAAGVADEKVSKEIQEKVEAAMKAQKDK